MGRSRAWTAVGAPIVVAALLAGCAGGGPGTDLSTPQAAAERWAKSLETSNSGGYNEVLAPGYRYDGTEGGSSEALLPGLFGAQGNISVEVLDVTQSGSSAVARVRLQYTGYLSDVYGGGGSGGQVDGNPGWSSPGFGPPAPPPEARDDGAEAGGLAQPPLLREVAGEQVTATPVSFTAIVILGLRDLDGVWMVVSQRQETSILLVGDGAEAPVITSLTGNGSERPEVVPRGDIEVRASIEGASGSSLFTRIGYIQRTLTLDGEIMSGVIRAPRIPGEYVLEVYAERASPTGAYGIATRSIEVEVLDAPAVGFSFTVADGVDADPAAATTVRSLLEAIHRGEEATPFFSPDYRYDGQTAESAAWNADLPFAGYGDSDIAATITAAEAIPGGQALTLEMVMEIDDFGGDGLVPVYDDAPIGRSGRSEDGAEFMPEPYGPNHSEATYRVEVGADDDLITAMRALELVESRGQAELPSVSDLLVNGSTEPALAGAERFTLTGSVTGSIAWAQVSPDQMREYVGTGAFTTELRAPFTKGRWLVRAEAWSWGDGGSARVLRTVEIAVTEDAPTPEVTVAPGVSLSEAARATVNSWLGGLYLGDSRRLGAAYSNGYAFDGLTKAEALSPRIRAYHADFGRAEVTAAANAGGATRLSVALEFVGPIQYFVDHRAIEWPEGPETGARDVIAPGYEQATTAVDVVIELGSDDRITAEWIRYGVSRERNAPALALGPVTVAGGSGPVTAGQHVEVRSGVTEGAAEYAAVRLGPSATWTEGPLAVVPAPTTPGRYVAEVVAQRGVPRVDYVSGDGSSETPPSEPDDPWTGIYVISAIEVRVQ